VNVEVTLWFFAGLLVFGVVNLVAAAVFLERRERAQGPAAPVNRHLNTGQILDVLALSLLLVVLVAVMVLDVQLVLQSAPTIGRPALYIIAALITEVACRLFALLPDTPRWLPRFLRVFEIVLLVLGVVGLLRTALGPASS
jgi:hypothetical protein